MKHTWKYKLYGHCKVRHHLLEILLWPNNDGTFRIIHNSMNKLKELGIYDDYKLTIEITSSEHSKLHSNNRSDEWNERASISHKGKEPWNKGKKCEQLAGVNNSMYGKDAWAISCSRKTPEEIEATRQSKRNKMKEYWATHPEAKERMRLNVIKARQRRKNVPAST